MRTTRLQHQRHRRFLQPLDPRQTVRHTVEGRCDAKITALAVDQLPGSVQSPSPRPNPRRSRIITGAPASFGTVCAALIAVLPLAPTFNSDEQAYLRELRNDGIPVSDDQATVTVGHDVCNLLASGGTKELAMNALPSNLDMTQRRTIVDASVTCLCPM